MSIADDLELAKKDLSDCASKFSCQNYPEILEENNIDILW